jgi:hypothetical protein
MGRITKEVRPCKSCGDSYLIYDHNKCLWIERKIDKEACKTDYDTVAEQIPENPHRWREVEKETEEKIELNITWDD